MAAETRSQTIERREQSDFLSLTTQLLSHFKRQRGPKTETGKLIWTFGLDRPHLTNVMRGHFDNRTVRCVLAVQALRLQPINRLVFSEVSGEGIVKEDATGTSVQAKQRRL